MQKEYYLYRHIRLDRNEPFYIGIGVIHNEFITLRSRYERAYSKLKRNPYWRNITSQTNYDVEIILESDNRELIIQKEIEFIKLYGRKDINTGILSNMTDGGEGGNGAKRINKRVYSEETRKKLSIANKGRTNESQAIKVNQFNLQGNFIKEFPSLSSTRLEGFDYRTVARCCQGKRKTHKKYIWKYVENNQNKILL